MNYQENESKKQRSRYDYYADYDSTIEALRDELESGRQNTDNSKPGSRDPADILPAWIFCPQRSRSPVTPIRFENCEVESDLPERFIFGELEPGSFKQLPTGFSARYASSYIDTVVSGDGDKLRFEVKIERSDPCYHAFSNICALAISFGKIQQPSNLLIFTMGTLGNAWNHVRVSQGTGQEESFLDSLTRDLR